MDYEKQYLQICQEILQNGIEHKDRTGTGTKRIFSTNIKIDLNNGFPMLTTRKMFLRTAVEELRWMLSGSTDVKKLQELNVHIWDGNGSEEECSKFGRVAGDLGPIYGHQWRNFGASKKNDLEKDLLKTNNLYIDNYNCHLKKWVNKDYNSDGVDQIKYLIEQIQQNPNSRRMVLSSWNPHEILNVNPPPCHYTFELSVIDGHLHMINVMRSNDWFLGTPTNIQFYAILMHLIAHTCGLKVGHYTHIAGDTHLYLDHLGQVQTQLERTPYKLPTITLNDRLKNKGFDGLMDFKFSDIELHGYQSHGVLKGKMSV